MVCIGKIKIGIDRKKSPCTMCICVRVAQLSWVYTRLQKNKGFDAGEKYLCLVRKILGALGGHVRCAPKFGAVAHEHASSMNAIVFHCRHILSLGNG